MDEELDYKEMFEKLLHYVTNYHTCIIPKDCADSCEECITNFIKNYEEG